MNYWARSSTNVHKNLKTIPLMCLWLSSNWTTVSCQLYVFYNTSVSCEGGNWDSVVCIVARLQTEYPRNCGLICSRGKIWSLLWNSKFHLPASYSLDTRGCFIITLVLQYSMYLDLLHNSPPILLILGLHSWTLDAHTRSYFPGDKAADTWSCPVTLI